MKNAPDHVETWVRERDAHFIVNDGEFLNPQNVKESIKRIPGFLNKVTERE